jgi:hypothetical protein
LFGTVQSKEKGFGFFVELKCVFAVPADFAGLGVKVDEVTPVDDSKKALWIPIWFSQYYSSEVKALLACAAERKCILCSVGTTKKLRDTARHLTSKHLDKRLPCPTCQVLVSNDLSLMRHIKKTGCK